MTTFQAAVLSCRILALYVLFQALSAIAQLPMAVISLWSQKMTSGDMRLGQVQLQENHLNLTILSAFTATGLLQVLLPGAFAAFLWFKAVWLARRIASAASTTEAITSPNGSDIQRVMLTMIGVLVLAFAIPEVGRAIALALMPSPDAIPKDTSRLAAENWKLLLQFVIGLSLMFGASTFSRSLDKLALAETKTPAQSMES